MALLDDLNAVRDKLTAVIATVEAGTVDPATGLPVGPVAGQHDPLPPTVAAVPDPVAEAADVAEDAAEATVEAPAPVAQADPSAGL